MRLQSCNRTTSISLHDTLPSLSMAQAGIKSETIIVRMMHVAHNAYAAVILLSFVLAVGFLLIILSCALWSNWLPLLVGESTDSFCSPCCSTLAYSPLALTFVVAPLPNAIFAHCAADDFSTEYEGSGPVDLGRFITSTIVVTGFALPLVLAHSEIIKPGACGMSIVGGA